MQYINVRRRNRFKKGIHKKRKRNDEFNDIKEDKYYKIFEKPNKECL